MKWLMQLLKKKHLCTTAPQRESPFTCEACFKAVFRAYFTALPQAIVSYDSVTVLTNEQVNMEVMAKLWKCWIRPKLCLKYTALKG